MNFWEKNFDKLVLLSLVLIFTGVVIYVGVTADNPFIHFLDITLGGLMGMLTGMAIAAGRRASDVPPSPPPVSAPEPPKQ